MFVTDDGKGTKEIFRVQNFDLVPLDEGVNGKFFGGDSYVIKYSYEKGGGQGHIIYFWQVLEPVTIKSENETFLLRSTFRLVLFLVLVNLSLVES